MVNAPDHGNQIVSVRGRNVDGKIYELMHYACGGGEEQPPFDGWFCAHDDGKRNSFYEVHPVEWQPMWALPEEDQWATSLFNEDNLKYDPARLDPVLVAKIEAGGWRRSSGAAVCVLCRAEYRRHRAVPHTGGLVRICNGDLVHL